jgi:hypothetical protein
VRLRSVELPLKLKKLTKEGNILVLFITETGVFSNTLILHGIQFIYIYQDSKNAFYMMTQLTGHNDNSRVLKLDSCPGFELRNVIDMNQLFGLAKARLKLCQRRSLDLLSTTTHHPPTTQTAEDQPAPVVLPAMH